MFYVYPPKPIDTNNLKHFPNSFLLDFQFSNPMDIPIEFCILSNFTILSYFRISDTIRDNVDAVLQTPITLQ